MVVSGFVSVSLPTLERRFHLRSVETGLIVAMYNVGSLLLMAPLTFFGSEMNKPRIMAIGVACMGLGSFIYSLPHFVAPEYKFSRPLKDLCPYVSGPAYEPNGSLRNYRFIFMLANLVNGCSSVPFYTLSVAYMDDNLSAQKSSWYIGIYYTAAVMGPAIGFILGGTFLKTYADVSVDAASIGLSPSSTVWVGAWWIGFVITWHPVADPVWAHSWLSQETTGCGGGEATRSGQAVAQGRLGAGATRRHAQGRARPAEKLHVPVHQPCRHSRE
ncbi:hypothetical protein MTO96_046598, partial [Rhipicephalus appendiculatus]